jgi:hypothetical protein
VPIAIGIARPVAAPIRPRPVIRSWRDDVRRRDVGAVFDGRRRRIPIRGGRRRRRIVALLCRRRRVIAGRRRRVADLEPISELTALEILYASKTLVSDLGPISHLPVLHALWLDGTLVGDVTPLARVMSLRRLVIDNTAVTDISPLQNHVSLNKLSIEGTLVSDLWPIAKLTNLQDAAVKDWNPFTEGLFFEGAAVTGISPFDQLVKLDQPACTVETINEVRRLSGLDPHLPDGYEPPEAFSESDRVKDDQEDGQVQLAQRPASHSFAFRSGLIEAQPQTFLPRHPEVAADIRDEVSEKAKGTSVRLANCNAPREVLFN